jgi:predicted transglutaminase-like cysteine proteinase
MPIRVRLNPGLNGCAWTRRRSVPWRMLDSVFNIPMIARSTAWRFAATARFLTPQRRAELVTVNAQVNRRIVPEHNDRGVAGEKWLISPARGDCNDYAVTKRHELLERGWPSRALLLAEVVIGSGEYHLVLVVRTEQGDLVADNLSANIRPWYQTRYRWVRVRSPRNPQFWATVAKRVSSS